MSPSKAIVALFASMALVTANGCEPRHGGGGATSDRDRINALLEGLPEGPTPEPRKVQVTSSANKVEQDGAGTASCAEETRSVTEAFDEVALLTVGNSNIVPGMILQGKSLSDGTVRVLDAEAGAVALTLPHPASVRGIAWHPDGSLLAAACGDFQAYVWCLATRQPVARGTPSAKSASTWKI